MYWNAYKLSINDKIYRLSLGDLKWEIIKARANLESKFTFIWSSVVFGVISVAVFNYGLDVATQVIKLGEAAEQDMINTVYMNFMLMIIGFTLFMSFAGWIVALFLKIPGKNAIWFYSIFFVMMCLFFSLYTIIIDFSFLVLNVLCSAVLLGAVADLKKQRVLIRLAIMENRLQKLEE